MNPREVGFDFVHCRAFVVVDSAGQLMTRHVYPAMAQVLPHVDVAAREENVSLRLTAPAMEEIEVRMPALNTKYNSYKIGCFLKSYTTV